MFGIKTYLTRNVTSITGEKSKKNQVNLEWWNERINLGDYLSKVVYDWMIQKNNIKSNSIVKDTKHLMGIGSIIGMGNCDAVIWGSGIHTAKTMKFVFQQKRYRNYDIRLVRGPITRTILEAADYKCPDVYGDPAVLMPDIYLPHQVNKAYKVSLIQHLNQANQTDNKRVHRIDVATHDYAAFIDQILQSKKIISSSLHGIILAETYGVPAIFLSKGMSDEKMKFFDWYFSTGRSNIRYATSLEEALDMDPMSLPDLSNMKYRVLHSFPYDLWNN